MTGENRERFHDSLRAETGARSDLAKQERKLKSLALHRRSVKKELPKLIESGRKFIGQPVIAGGKRGYGIRVDPSTGAIIVRFPLTEKKFSQEEVELA